MSSSVYKINKGINRSIEFKGLKAQYIWYLGGGVVALLILFAILYIAGVPSLICIGVVLMAGAGWIIKVYRMSSQYGEHGMMKKMAKRRVPGVIKLYSRKVFM